VERVRVSAQGKIRKIGERRTADVLVDLASRRIAAQDVRHFDIEEMWRVEGLPRFEQVRFDDLSRRRAEKDFDESRGVYDDHFRSRSARITSAGAMEGDTPERRSNRARNSSIDGRSATSRISRSR